VGAREDDVGDARAHRTQRRDAATRVAATQLDVANTTVHLSDDTAVEGTFVVVATGSRARHLGYSADPLLHTIRSRDDLVALEWR